MKKIYLSFIKVLEILENCLCYAGLVLCSFLVFIQVLNRYIFHFEIMWIGDLSLYFYVFCMILTIALTTREDAHTSVDVFVDMFFKDNERGRRIYKVVVGFMVLGILIYLLPMAYKMCLRAIKYPEFGTLVRWFNTSWLRELVFGVILLSLIHTVHNIGVQISALCQKKVQASEG